MQLITVGLNHHTAPVAVREQVAFTTETVSEALQDLVSHRSAHEAAIVSTCNRTELYCNIDDPGRAANWLAEYHHLKEHAIAPYLYTLGSREAVQHAFRVASGLDSMVIGEPQILGQMKDAVRCAERAGTLGTVLHKLFQRAFSVAKEVRSRTDIGASSVSMAAAAVRLAQQIFDDLSEQHVLFIGAGEMIELCAAHFGAHRPAGITVANRTLERARNLASRYQAESITLNELPEHLHRHDIVITSTASPLPILGKGLVERAIRSRRHRPMFMVDLAVPRDVEAEVAELDDVFLYAVDDLAEVVEQGFEARRGAVTQAEAIIDTNVERFMHWMEGRDMVPTIRALRDHAERQRRHEVDRALKLLARGEPPEKVLEALSHGLTNKFLHSPSHALNHTDGDERRELAALLARIYQFHNPE